MQIQKINKNDIDLKINIIAKPRKFVLFLFALVVTINSLKIRQILNEKS